MKERVSIKSLLINSLLLLSQGVFADNPPSFQEFIQKTKLDGNIRSYFFSRDYSINTRPHQSAFSLGGRLNVLTTPLHGISAGASFYAADPLGVNTSDFERIDPTLPGQTVNTLGQAFLQYQQPKLLVRGGNQIIKTPWLSDADGRMIPSTYQAILATATPTQDLDLTVFRVYRFKSHTSKDFDKSNLYDPNNYGGTPIPQLVGVSTLGALSGGLNYKWKNIKTQAWYYKFYDFANLTYIDGSYTLKTNKNVNPFIGAQLGHEWGDGRNDLETFGYGKTDATIYGIQIGLEIPHGQLAFGYNYIPTRTNAYKSGDLVSPYTTGYAYDQLYTTSMIAGLVEKAAGQAVKVSGHYFLFDEKLKLSAGYARYFTAPAFANTNETDIDVTYTFKQMPLKGLSIRNRLGILNGNPAFNRFVYNRIMLQYDF